MFKKLPFVLISVIIFSILLNSFIPNELKQLIYACSLTIKSIVLFILPFVIFGLLFKTFVKLADHAIGVILVIFGCLCTSNFINTFLTKYISSLFYHFDLNIGEKVTTSNHLEPLFVFELPKIVENDLALFGGIICGVLFAFINNKLANSVAIQINRIVQKIFSVISVLIPLFIIGFVIKCASENVLLNVMKSYSIVLVIFISYATLYTFLFYIIINLGSFKKAVLDLKNMFPAFVTALSTISSVVTMPITIMCVEKNVKRKELASSTISATVNIHLLGDCIAIPMIAYALLNHYGLAEPSLSTYFVFTIFFVIAKFSVAAVPAGGIIIMTPILEKYLGFTPEMSSLIIAVYVIFDPFVTGFNVLGNGAFAKLIDHVYDKLENHCK